jgi:hypothetical protein
MSGYLFFVIFSLPAMLISATNGNAGPTSNDYSVRQQFAVDALTNAVSLKIY